MANHNLKKPLLSAAVLACLLGGALTAIGSVSGGVNDLIHSANSKLKLTKEEKSFSDISSLNIDLAARNLVISQSPDDQAHLTYYQSDSNYQIDGKALGKITATAENGTLDIQEAGKTSFSMSTGIRSLLSLFDQESQEKRTIQLSLPKGTNLEKFSGNTSLGDVKISDLSVQNLDFSLSNGSIQVDNSQFAAGNLENSLGDITLNKSQFSSGKLRTSSGSLTFNDSQFSSGEIATDLGDISANTSKISDSNLSISNGSLNSDQLELAGKITITDQLGDVNLNLVSGSLSQLSFELKTDLGDISLPDDIQVNYGKNGDAVGSSATRKIDNAAIDLTVNSQAGSIKLSE